MVLNVLTVIALVFLIRRWSARLLTKWSSCGGEVCEYIPPCGPTGPRWRATWLSAWFLSTFMASSNRSSIRVPCTNRIPKMRLDYATIARNCLLPLYYILFWDAIRRRITDVFTFLRLLWYLFQMRKVSRGKKSQNWILLLFNSKCPTVRKIVLLRRRSISEEKQNCKKKWPRPITLIKRFNVDWLSKRVLVNRKATIIHCAQWRLYHNI